MHVRRSASPSVAAPQHGQPAPAAKNEARAKATSTPGAVDSFASGAKASAPHRPTQAALDFLSAYDDTLGLTADAKRGKRQGMSGSALEFYRASPALFVRDLQTTFASEAKLTEGLAPKTTVLVDPHLGNFGTFRGPDGKAVWGANDFDQSARGSPEGDLERLAASAVLEARDLGLSKSEQQKLVGKLFTTYADTLHARAKGKEPGDAFLQGSELHGAESKRVQHANQVKRKKFLESHGVQLSGSPHFKPASDLTRLGTSETAQVQSALAGYARRLPDHAGVKLPLQVLDVVRRSDGGGSSYGLPRYEVLLANDDAGKAPILLELKASPPSPLVDLSGRRGSFDAKAVAANQEALGGAVNPLSGWAEVGGQSFLARELEPEKDSVNLDKLSAGQLSHLVQDAAQVLARAHGHDAQTAAKLDAWLAPERDTAGARLQRFAADYADQAQRDFAAFTKS